MSKNVSDETQRLEALMNNGQLFPVLAPYVLSGTRPIELDISGSSERAGHPIDQSNAEHYHVTFVPRHLSEGSFRATGRIKGFAERTEIQLVEVGGFAFIHNRTASLARQAIVRAITEAAYAHSDWFRQAAETEEKPAQALADRSRQATQYFYSLHDAARYDPARFLFGHITGMDGVRDGRPLGYIEQYLRNIRTRGTQSIYVENLNVNPTGQGRGLATALAYTALRGQSKDLSVSLFAAESNEPMQAWAKKYGFIAKHYYDESGFSVSRIPFIILEAPNNATVLSKMEEARPELAKGKTTHKRRLVVRKKL